MKNKIISLFAISSILIPTNTLALTKQEVVFTTLDSNGKVVENIVNNHLKYVSKEEVEDETILKNILNISGKEKISQDGNTLRFKTNGKDITYQGTTDKELPITTEISYYLDGEKISKKKLLNKKGKVEIVVNFKNNSYNEEYGVKTPFVVTAVSIIKGNNNTNIEVSNGKVVNTGTKNVVVGMALPGTYENLGLDELKDMDKIIISYDTTKFENSDLYLAATPKMFEESDLSVFSKLDGLNSSMNKLQDGVNQLVDGANKLTDGTITFSQKLDEAVDGSKELNNGLKLVNSNMDKLTSLSTLVDTLYAKYQENNALLMSINNGSAKAQLEAGISDANSKLNDLLEKKAAYEGLKSLVDNGVTLPEDKQVIYNQLSANIDSINLGIEQYKRGITEAQQKLASLPTSAAALTGSNQTIESVLEGVLGINSMDQAPQAIELFKSNLNKLSGGVSELEKGSTALTNGLNQLSDASYTISNSTAMLRDGLVKLNEDGISKLSNISSKINMYKDKTKNMINASKDYKGYSSNNSNEVVFIYKVGK